MSDTQDALDLLRRKGGAFLEVAEGFKVRQIVVEVANPVLPFLPRRLAASAVDDKLLLALAHEAGHARIAGRIAVLAVNWQSVLCADLKQEVNALVVLVEVGSEHLDDGVGGLSAGMDDAGARQFELVVDSDLLLDVHAVRFDERIAEVRHVHVLHALAVERVDSDVAAGFLVRRPEGVVEPSFLQLLQDFGHGAVVHAARRNPAVILLERVYAVADYVFRREEDIQILRQLLAGIPLGRLFDNFVFQPFWVHYLQIVLGDL